MLTFLKRAALGLLGIAFLTWLITFLLVKFEAHSYTQITAEQRAQAIAYLEGKVSAVPSNWHWQTFEPEPGIELRTGTLEAPRPMDYKVSTIIDQSHSKGTVVFVPGFTGTIEMSMATITQLNQAGFRVAAIEYRGQGKSHRPLSNPEKGYVEDFAILASDVAQYAKQIRRDGEPLFFFSISKGAHITLRLAAEQNLDVDAFALVVPMVKINPGPLSYSAVKNFAVTLDAVGLGSMYAPGQSQWPPLPLVFGEANGCNSNPETAQLQSAMFALDETVRTRGTTVKWIKETVESTEKLLSPGFMDALTQPVIVFTAGDDLLVDTGVATEFCNSLAQCKVSHFPKARHCINRESRERMSEIIRQSVAHFESAIAGNSSGLSKTSPPQ